MSIIQEWLFGALKKAFGNLALLLPLLKHRRAMLSDPLRAIEDPSLPSPMRFATEVFLLGTAISAVFSFVLTSPTVTETSRELVEQLWLRFEQTLVATIGPLALLINSWLIGFGFVNNTVGDGECATQFPASKVCLYVVPAMSFWSYMATRVFTELITGNLRFDLTYLLFAYLALLFWSFRDSQRTAQRLCEAYEEYASRQGINVWPDRKRTEGIVIAGAFFTQMLAYVVVAITASAFDLIVPWGIDVLRSFGLLKK